jgi:hypothetical protein
MSEKDRPAPRRSTSGKNSSSCERNPLLTLGAHIRLAAALKDARRSLAREIPAFPATGALSRKILDYQRATDALRSELEDQLCALVPAKRDPRRLTIRLYFGNARLIPRYQPPDDPTDDAFAGWIEMSELTERKS